MVPTRYVRLGSVAAVATLVYLVLLFLPSSASRKSHNALADSIAIQQSVQDYGFQPVSPPTVPPSAGFNGHEEESHTPNVPDTRNLAVHDVVGELGGSSEESHSHDVVDTWAFAVHNVAHELDESSEEPIGPAHAPKQPPDTSTEETAAAPKPPPARSRIIVTGRLESENTDWIARELPDWPSAIYYIGLPASQPSPSGLRTPVNKGREAMPYLTYILDNYPNFPDVVVFIHPHQGAWHIDHRFHNAYYMLSDLRLDTVMQRGYANLRCNNDVGCPAEIMPFRDPPEASKAAENVFADVYAHFFHATEAQMRADIPVVATQCCAQFAVSSTQLLKRPKEDYERYRQFLLDTELDDDTLGRVMEYMWHMIFQRDAVHCEDDFECWCKLFGRCHDFNRGGGAVGWIGQ